VNKHEFSICSVVSTTKSSAVIESMLSRRNRLQDSVWWLLAERLHWPGTLSTEMRASV
jgi:hypothetical protein